MVGLLLVGLGGLLALVLVVLVRVSLVLRAGSRLQQQRRRRRSTDTGSVSVSVLVVAGSGGHTSEMLRLMDSLSPSYSPRHYVIADTDRMSEDKICSSERSRRQENSEDQFFIHRIPRSREVLQSWSSSIFSTLRALRFSIPLVFRLRPDVVLCNGPGTCVPLCVAALLLGILGMKKVVLVYVESICRVQNLSLTGKILYPITDYFFVQWACLRDKYPRSIFLGRIV
ncbi:UDP-N-acetylglucosamine transferase subunit ALG14 [Gouania willdenowi]|uniref:UDP-N-acetylglucosamine transferase subunit ALG14 n=1 Tax=Gouania willdenowi TaxID=441366 RepID=A0A8C5HFC6_GOUWI|nr:UDP-N-acetylglucosamine transferase subunit ALG14 homolog [Gouania willdenowi]